MFKIQKRFASFLIFFQLIFGFFAEAKCFELLTLSEVKNEIMKTATKYNAFTSEDSLMADCPNEVSNEPYVKKITALVMLFNAFSNIPKESAYDKTIGNFDKTYSDVPNWAKDKITQLAKRGVIVGKNKHELGSQEYITRIELNRLLQRIWRVYASRPEDDFYHYINKKQLQQMSENFDGKHHSSFESARQLNAEKYRELLIDILTRGYKKNEKLGKMANYYRSYCDVRTRNLQKAAPVKKFLKAIDESRNLNELIEAENYIREETGTQYLFKFSSCSNILGSSTERVLSFESIVPNMYKEFFDLNTALPSSLARFSKKFIKNKTYFNVQVGYKNKEKQTAYKSFIIKLLKLSGEPYNEAKESVEEIFKMESELSKSMTNSSNDDIFSSVKELTINDLNKIYTNIDIQKIANLAGFVVDNSQKVIIEDEELIKKTSEYINADHLHLLKEYTKTNFLMNFGFTLSSDFIEANNEFYRSIYGKNLEHSTIEEILFPILAFMPTYMNEYYVENNRQELESIKSEIETMTKDIIDIYEKRINQKSWLSVQTKKNAIKKLRNIKINVCYPNVWADPLVNCDILPNQEINFFTHTANILKTYYKNMLSKGFSPIDIEKESSEFFGNFCNQVNAAYSLTSNEVFLPFGILQLPTYSKNFTKEQNLGGIGAIIGHEIAHSFDCAGSQFDETGSKNSWWTASDYDNFKREYKKVMHYFDNLEIIPGVLNNASLTVNENIADLAGLGSSIELAKKIPNANLCGLFENFAKIWASIGPREMYEYYSICDPHSSDIIRTNRTISAIDEFYDIYNVKENDGMYTHPLARCQIW